MKFSSLLAISVLATSFQVAFANEMGNTEKQDMDYCKEQVESYGIEDEKEKSLFIQECMYWFKSPSGDEQAPQE